MGKTRRCRSVLIGASIAALGTIGACPVAHAANGTVPTAHAPRAVVAHKQVRSRRGRGSAAARGPYVYVVYVEGEWGVGMPNMFCTAAGARLTNAMLNGEAGTFKLWRRHAAAWERPQTITAGPATTITVNWTPPSERREVEEESEAHNGLIANPRLQGQEDTTTIGSVCGATSPDAALASVGKAYVTWRLPAPVRSLAALIAATPANIALHGYMAAFEVPPDGSVPAFTPFP